jgi:hypothetical protein
MAYPKRKRALEVLASFNAHTIQSPPHFLGWPYFFALVSKGTDEACREVSGELIKLMQCGQQERWMVPLYSDLFLQE